MRGRLTDRLAKLEATQRRPDDGYTLLIANDLEGKDFDTWAEEQRKALPPGAKTIIVQFVNATV